MPQDRTLKAIKTRSRSEQVSVISLLFLPLLGLCCLLLPEASTMALPFVLGGIMAVSGIGGIDDLEEKWHNMQKELGA